MSFQHLIETNLCSSHSHAYKAQLNLDDLSSLGWASIKFPWMVPNPGLYSIPW